jgi:hypothetical protein
MSFWGLPNAHDSWGRFCDQFATELRAAGLPEWALLREHCFRDLLRDGVAKSMAGEVRLDALPPDQWAALFKFVMVFFRECESYAPEDLFPAFVREVKRRS